MESLADPGTLRDRDDVAYREETCVDDPETFDYFAGVAGMVAVGVTSEAGSVLLMDGPHGWRLPYAPVAPDEDWAAVARRAAEALTGVAVGVDGAERVSRITHRREGDDEVTTTAHDVVLRAGPVAGEPVAADPSFGPWDDLDVAWFDAVPDDAYHDHGDAVDDVRRVLD